MPDEGVVQATQLEQGGTGETVSTGSEAAPQGVQPSQNSSQVPVENSESQASSQDGERRPASQYASGRYNKRLEAEIAGLKQLIQERFQPNNPQPSNGNQAKPGLTADDFWKDPIKYQQNLREEIKAELMGEIPKTFEQFNSKQQLETQMQEAKKMILSNEALKRDPNGTERIQDILQDDEFGLDRLSLIAPAAAAKLALMIYEQKNGAGRRNGNGPTKGQMASTATGTAPARKFDAQAEFAKISQEITANPNIVHDPKFKERYASIEGLYKQSQGQQ